MILCLSFNALTYNSPLCNCPNFDVMFLENHFRNILVELEHENTSLRFDNNEQKQIVRLCIQ